MNYYRRYVGDYLRDTSRLSMLEHGAYNLLLDYYYAEERPIPLDLEEVCRMVRAIRPEERKAIEKVLGLYFSKASDGYHQKRVDAEIRVSQQARENGGKGGRPKTGLITGSETGELTGDESEVGCETLTGLGQPPTTNHQPPNSNHQKKPPAASAITLSADGRWEGIDEARRAVWRQAYPAINLDAELAAAAAWAVDNPSNRKSNWGRFIVGWMKRAQDKAPRVERKPSANQAPTCEFRGQPPVPSREACGLPHAKPCPDYGNQPLCAHHRLQVEEPATTRGGMPTEVRSVLADMGHLRKREAV